MSWDGFLLEILSEEIPAGMQKFARDKLAGYLYEDLVSYDVCDNEPEVFSTPRRLTIHFKDLNDVSGGLEPDSIRGPRIGSPEKAIEGFLRNCGKEKKDLQEKDGYYCVWVEPEGRQTEYGLADTVQAMIQNFSWPKSMRWGNENLHWVRPLHSIVAILYRKNETKQIVFNVGEIKAGCHTRGSFNNSEPIKVSNFDDYKAKLEKAGIILDHEKRYEKILTDAESICDSKGLKLVEDYDLIDEITGLVESPFGIMGYIDEATLDLPKEVLQTSMKTHQKFLSVANDKGKIMGFITFADKHKPSKSTQKTILEGNQRVLSARLSDAQFFWENDLQIAKDGMKPWRKDLQKMTFQNKIGTQGDRIKRIINFVKTHATLFNVDAKNAETTAEIMKLDLCSDMVREFPELQGVMAAHYANHAGHSLDIVWACKEHYAPLGITDITPTSPLSVLLSLADKLDTLAGFWSVELTPTSSKDPFALRRAALGVIRLILDNNLRLSLIELLNSAFKPFPKKDEQAQTKLMDFFHERLKIYLRDKHDIPADTIDACRFGQGETDFALLTNRAKALHAFRPDAEFQNLLQGFKRAHNILHAEQKKDGVFYEMPPEPQYFQDSTETELYTALNAAEHALPPLMEKEQFAQMLQTLANLRAPIDAFFTQVQVNSDQSAVRRNRLCLLHKLCSVMKTFADFSRLNG